MAAAKFSVTFLVAIIALVSTVQPQIFQHPLFGSIYQNYMNTAICRLKFDPKVHCATYDRELLCKIREICTAYRNDAGCDKGPSFYCANDTLIEICRQKEACLTGPDKSVTAVKIPSPDIW